MLVLGVALVGLTEGLTTALGSTKDSELQTTAALFAAGQIEQLRAAGDYQDGDYDGDCGEVLPAYQWKETISPTQLDGLHEISVEVQSVRTGLTIYELRTYLFERPEDTSAGPVGNKAKARNKRSGRQ